MIHEKCYLYDIVKSAILSLSMMVQWQLIMLRLGGTKVRFLRHFSSLSLRQKTSQEKS